MGGGDSLHSTFTVEGVAGEAPELAVSGACEQGCHGLPYDLPQLRVCLQRSHQFLMLHKAAQRLEVDQRQRHLRLVVAVLVHLQSKAVQRV